VGNRANPKRVRQIGRHPSFVRARSHRIGADWAPHLAFPAGSLSTLPPGQHAGPKPGPLMGPDVPGGHAAGFLEKGFSSKVTTDLLLGVWTDRQFAVAKKRGILERQTQGEGAPQMAAARKNSGLARQDP